MIISVECVLIVCVLSCLVFGGAGSAQSALSVKSAEVRYQTCVTHHLSFVMKFLS